MQFLCFQMSYNHDKTWGSPYRASPWASNYAHKFIIGREKKIMMKVLYEFLILMCKKKKKKLRKKSTRSE